MLASQILFWTGIGCFGIFLICFLIVLADIKSNISGMLSIAFFILFVLFEIVAISAENTEIKNSFREYTGKVYWKYTEHISNKYSCEDVYRMIIELPNKQKILVKKVNYKTYTTYKVNDKITFDLDKTQFIDMKEIEK